MKNQIRIMILLALFLEGVFGSAFIVPVKGSPGEIRVPTDYSTIQEAINAANHGDIIFVYNRTYYEQVIVNKTIQLVGQNKSDTIVDGSRKGFVFYITANNVTITGFTIQNSGVEWLNSGVYLKNSHNSNITDNFISKNNWYGIWLENSMVLG